MGKTFIGSLRLAFALVCVGASLILGAHWFGLIPDANEEKVRARSALSEAIAVHSAAHVRKQQWLDLKTLLQNHVDRNPDLLSIGLRSDLGVLRVDTGHHAEIWSAAAKNARRNVDAATELVTGEQVVVPITLNRRKWGDVELCFRKPHLSRVDRILHYPVVRLVCFFVVTGIFAYAIFVFRLLGIFSETQVVPERVRQALDTLAEGLLVLDEDERVILANRAFAETSGIESDELTAQAAGDLGWVSVDESSQEPYPWSLAIRHGEVQTERMLRYRLPDGRERIFSVNAAPLGSDHAHRGALATFRDVTHVEEHRVELENMLSLLRSSRDEVNRKNAELEILATQDALTGCLNRRAFFDRYEQFWKTAEDDGQSLACVMVDIDHFKSVNDTHGHQVGDDVLRSVSHAIRDQFQDTGLVCRYGGEEFCVVLPQCDYDQAMTLAEELRKEIRAITFEKPVELKLTASLGISELQFKPLDPQDMINQADMALYRAKETGRNRVIAYHAGMVSEVRSKEESPKDKRVRARTKIPYQAVTALVSALSYRDANTAEHSRRVSDLCVRAADGLMDTEEIYILEIAALLHDIGKIGVPDNILLKPGPLTQEEWDVMGRHDRIGVEIVAGTFNCEPLNDVVSMHHAFYGGRARDPELPTGNDIVLGARLLTIADSYDAMISDRVYRKGRSHEEAIEELRRCAGTQFDPELVEHFTSKIEQQHPDKATGACSVFNQAAIQIGYQVERLADAIGKKDVDGMRSLAGRLGMYARSSQFESIAVAAEAIEQHSADADVPWMKLLNDARDLVDICRATQTEFLSQSLKMDSEPTTR